LCVPVRARGRSVACLYITHGDVTHLFGPEEERIGEFLGTLAGAALENAQGFAEVQAFSRELERRVEERTAELVQSGKMAAVGTLVAGLSHELNNPLAVVLGYAQALMRHPSLDRSLHKPLASIESQAQRCSNLVRALLDFSRSKPATREPIAPRSLFDSVVGIAAAQARSRGVTLRVSLPPTPLPDIVASTQDIESALLNLVTNALDATPRDGDIELTGEARASGSRPGVLLRVRDNGSGMSPEVAARVFDPFFTTKPVGQGTGLGLSLARQVVAAHGGSLDMETAEGRGTTMRIWLPAARGAMS
jgi:signal transduction histidine kinase